MKALVYKSTGSWYIVKTTNGKQFNARIKGVLKIDGITSTNPIAVGDEVMIELENDIENTVTITAVCSRRNYVVRQSPHNKRQHHIIASNLDQSILFATIKDPITSTGFIDRFLCSCEMYHLPAIIVFNKSDIYTTKDNNKFEEIKAIYEAIGYKVILTSIKNNEGIEAIKTILHNKTTLLSGHSGVGKTSFINVVFPKLDLKTQEVSDWSGKGMHTTTFAEMFDLPFGGKIIDTPGIRELGLIGVSKQELSGYFPEMKALINECKFNNCIHINEPNCAVKKALHNNTIAEKRYMSYLNILETISDKNY
ncbi:MAG: ribosome small subunit-dependent GTPase A [Chitinophagaceae bacterium]|nr:ribosome small subunit-dependent GTPase A [Chitinophagaceae bacterium]MCW5904085.1 ribosome small subunit-dependent GTPase A [Chitinophagaceae bacterium]